MRPRRGPERQSNTFSKWYTIALSGVNSPIGVRLRPAQKAVMTAPCIHGFRADQCASCRTCPHGLTAGGCGRCLAASSTAARRRLSLAPIEQPAPEDHHGFEIFYAPAVNGWLFRAPDSTASAESYRSVFLARKAIDSLSPAATDTSPPKRS